MNTTKYLQTDSRWSGLGYPKSPCTIGNSGCGEVSVVNAIIEMQTYAKYTPATIQSYCKQYADPNCNGTYWSGIPAMMKHYRLTEVKEHSTMDSLWKELEKGDRVAIYLMGSRKGGSKGVHWTSSGHFVCSVDYKYKDKKHYVYVKDSYSNSNLRNGWIAYEENMKNDVLKVWSGKLNGKLVDGSVVTEVKGTSKLDLDNSKLTVDGIGGKATVKAMQKFFGTTQDGVITGQLKKFSALYPALQSVQYGSGGSACIKKMQTWLGLSDPDGYIGSNTTKAWQKKLVALGYLAKNETIDGIVGVKTMKAWQECLNNGCKKKATQSSTNATSSSTAKKPYKAIDVSEYQGNIDWKKVKADGVVGAIIRFADGDYEDVKFKANMKNAKDNGLHIGAYIFSRAKTKAGAEKEATRLFNACKPYSPDMPLYIDLEAKGLEETAETVAQAFLNKIKALGGKGGVYANLNWWNNYLKKTAQGSFAMWVAQYNDTLSYKPISDVGMWQYSSKGKVNGIKGNVDMDKCYVEYWNKPTPTPTPSPVKKSYTGNYPSYRLTKTNAKVMADTVKWAKWIADFNDFHYGYGADAHHNGCYFCGTQPASKKNSGIKMWETTYCCNPFVTAAQAHGGGIATQFKLCANGKSWIESNYKKSTQYDNLGKPDKSKLKAGDVLCCKNGHVMLYMGDGKLAEAANGDDNVYHSKSWNDSISVSTLSNDRWKNKSYGVSVVFRYKGNVDCDRVISHGEVSDRVYDLQKYLDWYFDGKVGSADGIFGSNTLKYVKQFQEKELGKGQGDGLVGQKTIDAMKKVKK